MEPCQQAGPIGSLEATTSAIKETLERLENGQERFIHILESIAAQGNEISHLKDNQTILFERVRKTELKAVEQGTRITMAAGFVSAVIGVATAFVVKFWGKP